METIVSENSRWISIHESCKCDIIVRSIFFHSSMDNEHYLESDSLLQPKCVVCSMFQECDIIPLNVVHRQNSQTHQCVVAKDVKVPDKR